MARLEAQEKEIEALKKNKGAASGSSHTGGNPGAGRGGKGGKGGKGRGRGGRGGGSQGGAIPAGVVSKLNKTCHPWNAGKLYLTKNLQIKRECTSLSFQEPAQTPVHKTKSMHALISRTKAGSAGVTTRLANTPAQCSLSSL